MERERLENPRFLRRSQTLSEAAAWELLRDRRFQGLKFRRQHALGPFVADFYCHELRLVVEIDGGIHGSLDRQAYDRERDDWMRDRGLRVLRLQSDSLSRTALLEALTKCL